ncbi:farnesol dehydrogenase-like [Musca vetustissima]|uniref:farnesol dehydrogenase-like n=1 Tax=Musca vetustissima TaxID=27455 RepID=UPI002AB628F4|nr:farnesol dehydrogenase-like [Musca vetustissima]
MDRWINKVAVVTGASSGIGVATCKALVEQGMIVVGLARRLDKITTQIRPLLEERHQKNFHAYKCDVSNEDSVKATFSWIIEKFGGIDVLINNAGMLVYNTYLISPDNSEAIRSTVNTNILGVVWCTREAYRNMTERKFDGHIININSIVGHTLADSSGLNIYPSTKYAITAMTEVLRQELQTHNSKIKVSSISPGEVKTKLFGQNYEYPADMPLLAPEDIASAIVYCIQTPSHVQVHEMIVKPLGEKI